MSSRKALITVFIAVDCFTFLTGILGLGAMEKKVAVEGESHGGARQGRRRGQGADLGDLRKLEAQRLQYLQAKLIKQAFCGAVALPFRWERKPKKRSSLAVSSCWA